MPAAVKITIVADRTVTIRASVHDVQFTLVLSVVLVVLVVLLFLRSVRATIIAGVALPLSLITSFGVMWFAGFSLDNLSLMALTIGTGFVVDDAIVMIENIVRHMENGEGAMEAALSGAREIGFTVISLTMSLIAVFIPLLFMSGLVGRMFREFALTLDDRGRDLGHRLADADADDVLAHLAPLGRRSRRAHPGHGDRGALDRCDRRGLSPFAATGAAPSARHASSDLRNVGRNARALRDRAKRLPAAAGHRLDRRGSPRPAPTCRLSRCRRARPKSPTPFVATAMC